MKDDIKCDGAAENDHLPDLAELPESDLEQVAGGGFNPHGLPRIVVGILVGFFLP